MNQLLRLHPTVLLAIALMGVIVMMILPIPPAMLDLGLAISFALAILIFTVTLFVERPLDFSSFPGILLVSLMLRLALNVSSTKLIIAQGHKGTDAAGHVIEGFANFIMGGSVLQGAVIFCVLMIINFMVITKGAGRMAEVGARFALDGMPGRQMAIDSDLSSGAIEHAEARARRERELAEVTFYGSLDGASKFVKGDAVAGLLITLLNIVVGLGVGIVGHGMPAATALETYAILTIGDGLVGQLPAVIISVAAALLLARGNGKGAMDSAMLEQLGRHPAAIGTVAALMTAFALVPGLPFLPFMIGAAGLGLAAWQLQRQRVTERRTPAPVTAPTEKSMGDLLDLDDIHIEFSPDLVTMVLDPGTGLDARITSIRTHVATTWGIILPEMRLTDDATLPPGGYRIRIQGVTTAQDALRPRQSLVLLSDGESTSAPPGEDVREPVYGTPARWIAADHQEDAVLAGLTVVSPAEVLSTHLLEVIRSNLPRLLTLRSLRRLLDEFIGLSDGNRARANQRLLDELIPDRIQIDMLLGVLRLLLRERISIRNLPLILEAMVEWRGPPASPEALCEHVRTRIGFQMVAELRRPDGSIPLLPLAPEWEDTFDTYQLDPARQSGDMALPPDALQRLSTAIGNAVGRNTEKGIAAAIITSAQRRRFIQAVVSARGLNVPVLSYDELGPDARPALVGQIAA